MQNRDKLGPESTNLNKKDLMLTSSSLQCNVEILKAQARVEYLNLQKTMSRRKTLEVRNVKDLQHLESLGTMGIYCDSLSDKFSKLTQVLNELYIQVKILTNLFTAEFINKNTYLKCKSGISYMYKFCKLKDEIVELLENKNSQEAIDAVQNLNDADIFIRSKYVESLVYVATRVGDFVFALELSPMIFSQNTNSSNNWLLRALLFFGLGNPYLSIRNVLQANSNSSDEIIEYCYTIGRKFKSLDEEIRADLYHSLQSTSVLHCEDSNISPVFGCPSAITMCSFKEICRFNEVSSTICKMIVSNVVESGQNHSKLPYCNETLINSFNAGKILFLEGSYLSSEIKFWSCYFLCKYNIDQGHTSSLENSLYASCCLLNIIRCRQISSQNGIDTINLYSELISPTPRDTMKIIYDTQLLICDESLQLFPSFCGKFQKVLLLEELGRFSDAELELRSLKLLLDDEDFTESNFKYIRQFYESQSELVISAPHIDLSQKFKTSITAKWRNLINSKLIRFETTSPKGEYICDN